uniref:Uncharacterized protein n=1 Tax=Anguilla anguilla TaxID=7936 RepID=A0A0E9RKP6_ANGAN
MENRPISRIRYLPPNIILQISFVLFLNLGSFSSRTIHSATAVMRRPCPTSPNMTANKKGKVIIVYTAGFTSL